MKHIFKTVLATCVLVVALSPVLHAGAPKKQEDTSSAELKRIKSLAGGRWTSTTSMFGKKNQKVYTEFQVTSAGSAVLERIFPGTPQEMLSVYYDNNGKLMMTHYCMLRNRPTLKLVKSDGDTLVLDIVKVEDLKSKKDPHMGGLTFYFKDKNHFCVREIAVLRLLTNLKWQLSGD